MRSLKWYGLIIFLSTLLIPLVLNAFFGGDIQPPPQNDVNDDIANMQIKVYKSSSKNVEMINCYDYIVGVVMAEMPYTYNAEALKAQAVAAFTYTVNKMENAIKNPDSAADHSGGYVCDDYNHCKAYISKDDAKEKFGASFDSAYSKITDAVSETLGKVITYDGQPINAVFHSISGGITSSAKEIWGSDIAYLQSVDCAFDKSANGFESTVKLSHDDFSAIFYEQLGVVLPKDYSEWFGGITRFDSGTVNKITVAGTEYEGTYIRKLFSLRSANFELEIGDKNVVFTVYGYGHGVGMSQNGANCLANDGKSYLEILKYFYKDVEITDYKISKNV